MSTRLPLAAYLFILRKHLWLVLGTVGIVLAAGWGYAATRVPVFQAEAVVQILARTEGSAAGKGGGRDEGSFLSDQLWVMRNDDGLANEVLRHIRGEDAVKVAGGALRRAAGAPEEPPPPPAAALADLTPRRLRSMVSIAPIPPTSYFKVTARGPERDQTWAVANAYARVFADRFREKGKAEVLQTMGELDRRRGELAKALVEATEEIARFKSEHASIDFSPVRGSTAAETLVSLKRDLEMTRQRLYVLKREARAIAETLQAVGLEVRDGEGGRKVLLPAEAADPAADPRLSARVLALDVVLSSEGVTRAREAVEAQEAEVRRLTTGSSAKILEHRDVQDVVKRREAEQRRLARAVEAVLLKHSQDVEQAQGVVDDGARQVSDLERDLGVENQARARLEKLEKAAAGVVAELETVDGRIAEAERLNLAGSSGAGVFEIHSYARPADPVLVAPDRPVIYGTSAALALLLAAALAYVLEFLDDTVKTREDFDRLVRLPFLGYIPHIRGEGAPDLVVARGATGSPEVEAFRAVRTGIQFSRRDRDVRTFLVTSAGAGEGKTTVSVNVATAFTGGRDRVLLVDADLRRARIHAALGVGNSRGLTNVLAGEATLEEAVQVSTVPGLDVLSSGPIPPNPAEILGSERMQELLRSAASRYGRVVVDSPPLVAVTDPALLAKYVDAVFLVISIGKTSIRSLLRARETLSTVGISVHGAILNNADARASGYGGAYSGYGYGYGYGDAGKGPVASAPAGAGGTGA